MLTRTASLLAVVLLFVAALAAAPSGSGVTIIGQVAGVSATEPAPTPLSVAVVGTTISAAVQADGRFTLENVPAGTTSLRFTGQQTDAAVTLRNLAEGQQVQVVVSISGSSASIESEQRSTAGGEEVELQGSIASIDAASRILIVDNVTVSVPESATIRRADDIVSFDELEVDERVAITGHTQGVTVVASEIRIKSDEAARPASAARPVNRKTELSGTLGAPPTGTCPALAFAVNGTMIVTSSTTSFTGGTCADLTTGSHVEVTGTPRSSGVVATQVALSAQQAAQADTAVKGTLTDAPTGTCPLVSFTIGTTAISTTDATQFQGGACTDLAAGVMVEVRGKPTGSSMVAKTVSIGQ
jgi:hypothetical protein